MSQRFFIEKKLPKNSQINVGSQPCLYTPIGPFLVPKPEKRTVFFVKVLNSVWTDIIICPNWPNGAWELTFKKNLSLLNFSKVEVGDMQTDTQTENIPFFSPDSWWKYYLNFKPQLIVFFVLMNSQYNVKLNSICCCIFSHIYW